MSVLRRAPVALLSLLLSGCASLAGLEQVLAAPQFEVASERQSELRLLGPSLQRPLGGADVRIWARVSNPNPFRLTLSTVRGSLSLSGTEAADVDLPLGLPLPASQDTVIPLDIAISFANLPALADVLSRAVGRGSVDYRLHGTFAVDAGVLGQPQFGPLTLLEGEIQTRR